MDDHDDDFAPPAERISKRATGPSRSQRKREALDVLALASTLMAAPAGQVQRLVLPDELAELVATSRRVQQQIARKRQTQYLAKQLRRQDAGLLETIRSAFAEDRDSARREAARLHRVERLRDRLLAEGDGALEGLLDEHPQADATHLRQLLRQARKERDENAPPHAARALFRTLRDLLAAADERRDGDDASGDDPGED
ncbi:MAG: ribosome biogenesis factor YjgA [Pseudoxanthomonas sp.]|nr:ribosome biogenesis factor YjgA [Pseudoxanthomonas sp.]